MVKFKFLAQFPVDHLYYYYYYYYYYYSFGFFTPALAGVFSSASKWLQVFFNLMTLRSILADLNNAVVWMLPALSLSSNSSSFLRNPLGIVPNASITIRIIVTFMFHSFFFYFSVKVQVLASLFNFFDFHSMVHRDHRFKIKENTNNTAFVTHNH